MRQAVMTKPGSIEVRSAVDPKPGRGEVLLRVRRIGVCGSDVHVWHGRHPFTPYPVVQGHEFSGVVEAVGEGVTGIRPGMKATATPQIVCGACKPCRRGDYNICDHLKVQGFQAPGVAGDYFVTSADKVVPLPERFTFEQGAMVEPAAVAVHSTGRAGDLKDVNAVVVGAGPIGNLIAQAAKARGAAVLITDISDYRLDVARRCGLERVSNARAEPLAAASQRVFGKQGFSVAFECVGNESALASAIATIEKGGRVMIVGVFGEKPRVDMAVVGDRELSLVGSLMYRKPDYEQAVRWIEEGAFRTEPLFSKHFAFEQYADAYRFIDAQADRSMKVFIDL